MPKPDVPFRNGFPKFGQPGVPFSNCFTESRQPDVPLTNGLPKSGKAIVPFHNGFTKVVQPRVPFSNGLPELLQSTIAFGYRLGQPRYLQASLTEPLVASSYEIYRLKRKVELILRERFFPLGYHLAITKGIKIISI